MTIDQQAQELEKSYVSYARVKEQRWRSPEDRQEAIRTLKHQLAEAERVLQLPPAAGQSRGGRSKLILWGEMARAAINEAEHPRKTG
jgi:hypothetical protein